MNFRDIIPDYDLKIRKAEMIARENAGEVLNIFDFMPPGDNPEEARLIIKALIERNDGYVFPIQDEKDWKFPFYIKVARALGVE